MMIAVVLFVMFVDRLVIKLGCMSLYKGKWRKISLNKPQNIIDILSLVYLVQKANANRKIIGAEIVLYNIALFFSIIYVLLISIDKSHTFGLFWGVYIAVQLLLSQILNYITLYRKK